MSKKDNIAQRFETYRRHPQLLQESLANFHYNTEKTYNAFKNLMEKHADIGKGAIIIMANNFAAHMFKLANDESIDEYQRRYELAVAISPLYELLYDRLATESIDAMLAEDVKGA